MSLHSQGIVDLCVIRPVTVLPAYFYFLYFVFVKLKHSLSFFGRNFVVFDVAREEEFSPLKNADGTATDNPTTARHSLLAQHCRWVTAAGAKLLDEHGNVHLPSVR